MLPRLVELHSSFKLPATLELTVTDALKDMVTHNSINTAQCYFWIYKHPTLPADCPGPLVIATKGGYTGAGSRDALRAQIEQSAPADVFASAATKNMDQVVTTGNASNPQNFAQNVMEVAVPPSNPAKVTSVNDLAKSSVKVALCQPQVPCGVVAAQVFKNAKLTVKPVTLQPDVKSVLTQVELGNVDAGVVYVTDVQAAGSKVKGVTIPANVNATTTYPIAALTHSKEQSIAQAFVAYVLSPPGEQVLKAAGFEQP